MLDRPFQFAALVLSLGLAACASEPSAGSSDAAARGEAYAAAVCSDCHAIYANETLSIDPFTPSFQDIADTPGMTRRALNAWFHSSHESMPQFIIDPDRIDDLWAYLATLKGGAAREPSVD